MSLVLDEQKKLGIFFLSEQDCNGKEVSLETYKGKVLLVVNVASKWYHLFPLAVDRIVLFLVGVLVWKMLKRLVFLMPPVGSRRPITRS